MATSCCPKTFTGFCLSDGTPIGITIDNGAIVSWVNIITGVVTPGSPPAGTTTCDDNIFVTTDPLTCATDSVTICPGVDPIVVNQGTSPWVVSGTVSVTEPVTVDAVDFDIRDLNSATDSVTVVGTISVTEPVSVDDNGGSLTVDAVNLDTRDLVFATDKVDVSGSTVTIQEPLSVDDNGGSLTVDGVVTVANPGLTDTELRASAVQVKDDYQTGEILADQSGAGAVLTFTFASSMSLVVVQSVGTALVSRADPFGGTPSAVLGIRCDDGVPVYIPVQTSSVKVFAPVGTTVTVYGLRRT